MKHLSDDRITNGLENLGQKFKPSHAQKESAHRNIFQENGYRKKVRIQTWIPTVVTFILLISIISGAFFLINDNGSLISGESSAKGDAVIDVTDSWRGMELKQSINSTYTNYIISFKATSLRIQEEYESFAGYNPNLSKEKISEKKKKRLKHLNLPTGEFTNYSVEQKKDTYIITVSGEEGFTYTLKKVAPRKFIGQDGIEFSANIYVE